MDRQRVRIEVRLAFRLQRRVFRRQICVHRFSQTSAMAAMAATMFDLINYVASGSPLSSNQDEMMSSV
jgi:hypothetical protein